MPPNPLQGGLVYGNVTKVSFQNLQIFYISGFGGRNYTFQKQLFFIKLKKPKNKGRGLKSWGIVENGLYFENVRKKPTKLMLGFKNGSGKTKQTFGAHCIGVNKRKKTISKNYVFQEHFKVCGWVFWGIFLLFWVDHTPALKLC